VDQSALSAFLTWARGCDDPLLEGRSRASHEEWMATLTCPILRLDGSRPPEALREMSSGGFPRLPETHALIAHTEEVGSRCARLRGRSVEWRVLGEDLFDDIRVVGRDRGSHTLAEVQDEGDVLVGPLRVEIPPVEEVSGAPDAPATYLVDAGEGEPLDASDRGIGNSLGTPWVVVADRQCLVVATEAAVAVGAAVFLVHGQFFRLVLGAWSHATYAVSEARMNNPATFSLVSKATRAFMSPAS
jgi:hypothetical protein